MPVNQGWRDPGGVNAPFMDNQQQGFGGSNQNAWGSAFSGLSQGLMGLLFPQKNPAEAAQPYLNKIPGTLQQYYSPYVNMGHKVLPELLGQYQSLLGDPAALMNKIGASFQSSPGFQFNVDQATRAANQAAAAGGMAGSPMEQQQLAQTVSGLANQDFYNYLQNALGLHTQGLQGLGNLNQMGFNASSDLAKQLSDALMGQANLAYQGQQQENMGQGGGWGNLLGGLGTLLFGL